MLENRDKQNVLVVHTTCADAQQASTLARQMVSSKLVACVNILPRIRSVYEWEGEIQEEEEQLLIMKTVVENYPQLEQTLLDCHPYDVPEIIALPVTAGSPTYLQWVAQTVELKK